MKRILILSLIALFILTACSSEEEKGILKYETKSYEKVFGDSTSKIKGYAKIKLSYPVITETILPVVTDEFNTTILNFVLGALFKEGRYRAPEYFITNFFKEYQEFKDNNMTSAIYWELDRKVEILYTNERIASIMFYEFSFLGGAHPNTNYFYTVYDLISGLKLKPEEVFVKGFEPKLNLIAEKKFREVRGLKPEEDLNAAGYQFQGNKFNTNTNFALTKEGVVFQFNAYEVAPYYMGSTKILIPYGEIESLIREKYKVPVEKK